MRSASSENEKGLYAKAGLVKGVTSIDDLYILPANPGGDH